MKIRYLIVFSIVILLWESLLGHTRLFGAVDLYVVLGALSLLDLRTRTIMIVFTLGVIVGFVSVGTIGLMAFAYSSALLAVLAVNKFSDILTKEMNYIAVVIFLCIYKILLIGGSYIIYDNLDLNLLKFLIFLVSHIVVIQLLKYILRPTQQDNSFIV